MKRFVAVLSGLLVLPAFAEVAPVFYDEVYEDVVEYSDAEKADVETEAGAEKAKVAPIVQSSRVGARGASNSGRAVSRALSTATGVANNTAKRTASAGRVMPTSRTATTSRVSARAATPQTVNARGTVSRTVMRPTARTASNGAAQIAVTRRAMQNSAPTVNPARASIVQTDTVNAPLYTGRVATRASSAIRARMPSAVASTSASSVVSESVEEAAVSMDELAQITDFCKAQYTQCMDNFCNVLDDNQGRCSCSKNLKNYAKTEEALKAATEALQDVAQQIQYIGLSADEVETLFTQTAAEDQMQSTSDNTKLKNDLDKIKKLIVDVKTSSASSTETTDMSFDLSGLLDFNVDSTGFDLGALFGGTQANTSSISNQRGEQLYKTASSRCKTAILTDCQAQGVDISIITNAYDLEIDKQCIAYERNLTDGNEEMSRTVRNAKGVLQRARLMVAQQKNAYDLRGCVNALDSCMQDDFVCGTDYENCIDPTGKYIVNGEVVIGSTPGQSVKSDSSSELGAPKYYNSELYATWNYGTNQNAWGEDGGSLGEYITATVTGVPTESSSVLSNFLQHKIGYNDGEKNYGMCMSVLNKCQDITYKDGKYQPNNPVIKEYLQRTLVQIKTMQDSILAEHAENCLADVSSCLSQNNYELSNNIAINACRQQILTCMSVNGDAAANPTPDSMIQWVKSAIEGEK